MEKDLLLGLLATVLTGVATWALREIVPNVRDWFNEKVSVNAQDALRRTIEEAIRAAEVLLKGRPGAEKLAYVLNLADSIYEVDNEEMVRSMVEAAVYWMKRPYDNESALAAELAAELAAKQNPE